MLVDKTDQHRLYAFRPETSRKFGDAIIHMALLAGWTCEYDITFPEGDRHVLLLCPRPLRLNHKL